LRFVGRETLGAAISRVLFSSEHMISSSPNWDQPSQITNSCGYCSPSFSPYYYKDPVQGRYLPLSLGQRTSKRAAGRIFTWPCCSHARVVFRSRICKNSPTCSMSLCHRTDTRWHFNSKLQGHVRSKLSSISSSLKLECECNGNSQNAPTSLRYSLRHLHLLVGTVNRYRPLCVQLPSGCNTS
jgi:hypothetical protein